MQLTIKKSSFHECDKISWNRLILESDNASFFQTYEWLNLWLKHFETSLDDVFVLEVYDRDILIGIGPFSIINGCIQILGTTLIQNQASFSDYGDIIAKSGHEKLVWLKLLETLHSLHSTSVLELLYLKEHSSTAKILSLQPNDKLSFMEVAPYIELPDTWETYLNHLSSHHRHELKRKLHKAMMHDLKLMAISDKKNNHDFMRLASLSKPEKASFYASSAADFFQDILSYVNFENNICTYLLMMGDSSIASCIIINFKNTWMAYNSALDPEYQDLSPGIVLFGLIIQKAIMEKKQYFDFLRGNESYKYKLGANDERLLKIGYSL